MYVKDHKIFCEDCGWKGTVKSADRVIDPKPLPNTEPDHWVVCPDCRAPENMSTACDFEDCWLTATIGTPTNDGYRWTCHKHCPKSNVVKRTAGDKGNLS